MNHLKYSLSKVSAIAVALGLAACGHSDPPATSPSSAQSGSTMSQPGANTSASNGAINADPSLNANANTTGTMGPSGPQGPSYDDSTSNSLTTADNKGPAPNGSSPNATTPSGNSGNGSSGVTNEQASSTDVPADDLDTSNLDDAQLAAVVQAINDGEIQAGQMAVSKASSPAVKEFARQMVSAHRGMETADRATLSRAKITPTESPASIRLTNHAQTEQSNLQSMRGSDFDHAYIEGQIHGHQQALAVVERMATEAKSPELKTALQGAVPKIQMHLKHAQDIEQKLQSK